MLVHGNAPGMRVSAVFSGAHGEPKSLRFLCQELIEGGLGVGLGPQTDLAGLREALILHVEVFLAVEEALDVLADHLRLERVPLAGRYFDLGVLELGTALPARDLVDA